VIASAKKLYVENSSTAVHMNVLLIDDSNSAVAKSRLICPGFSSSHMEK
jgi:hypothetical protein